MRGLIEHLAGAGAYSHATAHPLTGGVSSEILLVEAAGTTFCVKRALPALKVAQLWEAPVERNHFEAEWMRVAAEVVPHAVPRLLAEDRPTGALAMEWLPPERFPVWKAELAAGRIDPHTAGQVGESLGKIHARTADDAGLARRFATDTLFRALRLDPYLLATAARHPELAPRLGELVDTTAATRRVLVHGDFSPKNLLIGPRGPVILDAECAWFGDPAFDLAFVSNHLLLKGAWRRALRDDYARAANVLIEAYRKLVWWEAWEALEARTAALLPALMLARIDGKSPVEYLTDQAVRRAVRSFAAPRIASPQSRLDVLVHAWIKHPLPDA